MSSSALSAIAFAAVFGGALLGMELKRLLPAHHQTSDSKDVVKLAMGLIATTAALVLGLLTGSAKSTFDTQDNEVKQTAAQLMVLDRTLANYGPETTDIRDIIRRALALRVALIWPEDSTQKAQLEIKEEGAPAVEIVEERLRALSPQNDGQKALQARALQITGEITQTRWLVMGQAGNAVQMPLLIVLVFWLSALFVSFGLFAPRNGTVVVALMVAALSVSGSIFLILEMNQPFNGVVKISSAPLQYTLAHLGK